MNPLKILACVTPLLLTACHQDNPLKTESPKAVATFLMNASANVEKRLQFPIPHDAFGHGYLECMEGKVSPEMDCPRLFSGMVAFANENHFPPFKNITLTQLTDKVTFEAIADDYAEIVATVWPHYFSASNA